MVFIVYPGEMDKPSGFSYFGSQTEIQLISTAEEVWEGFGSLSFNDLCTTFLQLFPEKF